VGWDKHLSGIYFFRLDLEVFSVSAVLAPPQVPAAVRSSRLSCGKVGKAQIFTSARESSGESRFEIRRGAPMKRLSRVELIAAAGIICVVTGLLLPSAIFHSLYRGILVLLCGSVGAGLILGTQAGNSVSLTLTSALLPSLLVPLTYIGFLVVRYAASSLVNIRSSIIWLPGVSGGYIPVEIFSPVFASVALFLWIIASSAFAASYLIVSLAALGTQPILAGLVRFYQFGEEGFARVQRLVMALVALVGAIFALWSAFNR
jgi:hypothetical protein